MSQNNINVKESYEAPICRFRTSYNYGNTKKFGQDLSRIVEDVYELDQDGNPVKVGETNIYEMIQASKDECEIYNILKKYESGDLAAIPNPSEDTISGDFTKVKTDVFSGMDYMEQARKNWESLPKALRAMYDNDITRFMAAPAEDISSKINAYVDSLNLKDDPKSDVGGDK